MARIVHIALKVEDLEKATKFYEDVFGIYQLKTGHARGHSRKKCGAEDRRRQKRTVSRDEKRFKLRKKWRERRDSNPRPSA